MKRKNFISKKLFDNVSKFDFICGVVLQVYKIYLFTIEKRKHAFYLFFYLTSLFLSIQANCFRVNDYFYEEKTNS